MFAEALRPLFSITIAEDGTVIVEEAPPEALEALVALAPDDADLAERLRWTRDAR